VTLAVITGSGVIRRYGRREDRHMVGHGEPTVQEYGRSLAHPSKDRRAWVREAQDMSPI
jgi:hypothetical protein